MESKGIRPAEALAALELITFAIEDALPVPTGVNFSVGEAVLQFAHNGVSAVDEWAERLRVDTTAGKDVMSAPGVGSWITYSASAPAAGDLPAMRIWCAVGTEQPEGGESR